MGLSLRPSGETSAKELRQRLLTEGACKFTGLGLPMRERLG